MQTLLTDTHGPTHSAYSLKLESLIMVQRVGEKERYNDKIGNDTLLWHGSRTSNFDGIIKNGLRIAPPEAPVTGYMFGKERIHILIVLNIMILWDKLEIIHYESD